MGQFISSLHYICIHYICIYVRAGWLVANLITRSVAVGVAVGRWKVAGTSCEACL